MQAVWIALTVLIVGGCIWSLLRRFTSKKTCCGTEKQPRIRVKKLSAPIGSLTVKISGMRCENCRRSVTAALDALDGVAAKVSLENGNEPGVSMRRPNFEDLTPIFPYERISLENGTARVSFERPLSDEELAQAVESAGFDVLEIRH